MGKMIDGEKLLKWAAENPLIDYKAFDELESYIHHTGDTLAHYEQSQPKPNKLDEMIAYAKSKTGKKDTIAELYADGIFGAVIPFAEEINRQLKELRGERD